MTRITQVTLFKHGVGYFEREVEVQTSRSVRLSVKATDMDDI